MVNNDRNYSRYEGEEQKLNQYPSLSFQLKIIANVIGKEAQAFLGTAAYSLNTIT